MGTGGPFPRGKALPGRDADLSPSSSAEVVNELELGILPPPPPRLHGRVVGVLYVKVVSHEQFNFVELVILHIYRIKSQKIC
jgi:hypothetical protein